MEQDLDDFGIQNELSKLCQDNEKLLMWTLENRNRLVNETTYYVLFILQN